MVFLKLGFNRFSKNLKSQVKSVNFSFLKFFFTCVTNLIQMIFKYVAFTWPNLCVLVVILCPAFVS